MEDTATTRIRSHGEEIDLGDLLRRLWSRSRVIALCTFISAASALTYALMATPIFRAEAVLSLREDERGGSLLGAAGQLGGLADLAGLTIPGSKDKSVAVATLRSRALIEQFIGDNQLVDVLFEPGEGGGLMGDGRKLTVWDAHRKFMLSVYKISEDKKTGLITVAVEWKDPERATKWVTEIVARADARLRSVAIDESEKNLAYLEAQAKATNVIEIRQSLFRLAETEIKKLMMARGAGEYVFKTIDPARVPERKIKPKRGMIAVAGTFAGLVLGVMIALLLGPRSAQRSAPAA